MVATIKNDAAPIAWMRSARFDSIFVGGIFALGVVASVAVWSNPSLWAPILMADLWLLGYHHVISTYSRLGFDKASLRENIGLITWLPLVVIAAVAALGLGVGVWTLTTIYLYWQAFHYSRQSWGIARIYDRKSGGLDDTRLFQWTFYAVPVWGILHRSAQSPDTFLGADVWVLPVPELMAAAVGVVAMGLVGWWVVTRVARWRAGTLSLMSTAYQASHMAIFAVGYLIVPDIDHGWLALNVWHNAQYIAFVWHFNAKRAADPERPPSVVGWFSKPQRVGIYLLVSVTVSTIVYVALRNTIAAAVAPIVVYQAVNFHHYLVDGLIWKVRAAPIQRTLGLDAT